MPTITTTVTESHPDGTLITTTSTVTIANVGTASAAKAAIAPITANPLSREVRYIFHVRVFRPLMPLPGLAWRLPQGLTTRFGPTRAQRSRHHTRSRHPTRPNPTHYTTTQHLDAFFAAPNPVPPHYRVVGGRAWTDRCAMGYPQTMWVR